MDLTSKQLKKMMTGIPVQLPHSVLSSIHPEVLSSLSEPLVKKISRAVREGRGARIQLHEHEREMLGGKIDWKKLGHTAKSVAKFMARPLISGATNALVDAGLTAVGQPELIPFVSPAATLLVNKGLDRAKLGFGLKEDIQKAVRKSTSLAKRASKPMLMGVSDDIASAIGRGVKEDIQKAVRKTSSLAKRASKPMLMGVADDIASAIGRGVKEDIQKVVRKTSALAKRASKPALLGVADDISAAISPLVEKASAVVGHGKPKRGRPKKGRGIKKTVSGDESSSDDESVSPKHLKKMLMIYFAPHVKSMGDAHSLAKHIMDHGIDEIENHHLGGSLMSSIKKGAKRLYNAAKPIIRYFGEEAIKKGSEYARPALEEALGSVASQYGVDPSIVKMGTDTFLNAGEDMARSQLHKHTSQTPFADTIHHTPDQLHSLQNKASTKSPSLISKSAHLADPFEDPFGGFGLRISSQNGIRPLVYGGAIQTHMGTLLDHTNPAWIPFRTPPNLPQGQVSGGSFRAYGIRGQYGGSFM